MQMHKNEITFSVDTGWRSLVRDVMTFGNSVPAVADPFSIGSQFGDTTRCTRELIATRSIIRHPRNRLIFSQSRKLRLDYAIAQFIWVLAGSDELAPMAFYNLNGLNLSDNGKTVRSAIGPRLFGSCENSQFWAALRKLRHDTTTRRAMMQIYLPSDLTETTRDVSCTGSLHLLVRNGKLDAISHMRSQSVLMVLPYDLFLLTMIHEFAAMCAGYDLGCYWHICNSAHIYDDELERAETLLLEPTVDTEAMPIMDVVSASEIERVIGAERYIRQSLTETPDSILQLEQLDLSPYWRDLLLTLAAGWKLRFGLSWNASGAEKVPMPYRTALRLAVG